VNVIGIDELDSAISDVLHALPDLVRPRALPLGIERFVDQALVQLVGDLLTFLRGKRQKLAPEFGLDRHHRQCSAIVRRR